jgi:hypothetical protein
MVRLIPRFDGFRLWMKMMAERRQGAQERNTCTQVLRSSCRREGHVLCPNTITALEKTS